MLMQVQALAILCELLLLLLLEECSNLLAGCCKRRQQAWTAPQQGKAAYGWDYAQGHLRMHVCLFRSFHRKALHKQRKGHCRSCSVEAQAEHCLPDDVTATAVCTLLRMRASP